MRWQVGWRTKVALSDEERFLEAQVRRYKAAPSLSDQRRMILFCAEGLQSKDVAERLGVHEDTVGKWRRRFVQDWIEGPTDEYRPGRPRHSVGHTGGRGDRARAEHHAEGRHPRRSVLWLRRHPVAYHIRRIWTAFGLQPHRSEAFKLSVSQQNPPRL